jgi:nicotinate-nucleotide adenylyltransferase
LLLIATQENRMDTPPKRTGLRLGLYGGSFDPVHLGHLLVARAACEELGLDRLFFIPAAQSPFKPHHVPTPAALRLRLLRLALAGEPGYQIDNQEIARGGISYTIETVREYVRSYPGAELFYLIGADHVEALNAWREAAVLATLVKMVVIPRPGERALKLPAPFVGRELAGFPLGVSSSQIRARVQAGLSIRHLVPEAVAEAIGNSGLYVLD